MMMNRSIRRLVNGRDLVRILDLFCGVGGASVGYALAGHDVVGVDIEPQPDYPFEFELRDALYYPNFESFDVIHASPPCQADCTLTAGTNQGRVYRSLTDTIRNRLLASGKPFIIENPPGRTSLRRDLVLCGEMFSLGVIRHRVFEYRYLYMPGQPVHPPHRGRVSGWRHGEFYPGPYTAVYGNGGGKGTVAQWREAMGIDWTWNRKSIAEAVPPAYTEWIGRWL